MVRWPGNKKSAEEVYHSLNEVQVNIGGTYPVGQNGCWHSGIHIYSNTPVYPVTNGTLIACRINKEYIPVRMPDMITRDERIKLEEGKKGLYHEEKTDRGEIVYKLTDENATDGVTGGFMLLKHRMYLPVAGEGGKSNEPVDFFSLYMNLLPYKEISELHNYCDGFQPVQAKRAPFYITWLFKVTPDSLEEYSYKEIAGKKVFPQSRFKTTSNVYAEEVLKCNFENVSSSDRPVDINSGWVDIEKMKKKYVPNQDDAPVYSAQMRENAPSDDYLLTSINSDAYFTTLTRYPSEGSWDYNTGYFKVKVYPNEIKESTRELGLYLPALSGYKGLNNPEAVNNAIGPNGHYECTGADDAKIILKIKTGLTRNHIPHDFKPLPSRERANYKVVKLTEFLEKLQDLKWYDLLINFFDRTIEYDSEAIKIDMEGPDRFIKSIAIANSRPTQTQTRAGRLPVNSNKLVIILKNGAYFFNPENYQENRNQMAFYCNNQQIFPYVDTDVIFDRLGSEPDGRLSVYYATPLADLFPKDSYLEIVKNQNFSCSYLTSGRKLLPCRISFGGKNADVLIKASHLRCDHAYGHVKRDSGFFDRRIKGLPVYDDVETPKDKLDNMRAVLTEGEEFSLEDAGRFLENHETGNRYAITHEDAKRYVVIKDKAAVHMKAGIDTEKYGEDNTVAFPSDEMIRTDMMLGHPAPHKQYKNLSFYDFVMLFKNNEFMNNDSGRHSYVFIIPEDVKIYKEKEKPQTTYMFPPGTIFNYEEKGKKDEDTIYELKISSMDIYILRDEENIEGKGAVVNNKILIGKFSTIEVYDSYISYDEQSGEPTCNDERLGAFARAFGTIRNRIKESKLTCTGTHSKGGKTEKRFLVDFSGYDDFQMPFWVKRKDISAETAENKEKQTFTYARKPSGNSELELTVYEENPLEAEFEEEEREGALAGILELKKTTGEKEGKDQRTYLGFNVSDKLFYAVESEIQKKDLLEWKEYFTVFEEENDNDIVCDRSVEDRLKEGRQESFSKDEMAKEKRKVVCRHPLDWDREQYTVKKIKNGKFFGYEDRHELLLEKMEAIEIWKHIKDHADIKQEKNNFWYAHPVYFMNHIERAGLLRNPRIDELLAIQDRVVKLACLEKGVGKGIFKKGEKDNTYCNHAVYLTIKAVDKNFENFLGVSDLYTVNYTPPDDLRNLAEKFKAKLLQGRPYPYKVSNLWCDILNEQATRGILAEFTGRTVEEIETKAQEKANEGYVVIGAWKNKNGPNGPPHFATVRPETDPKGPMILANVGATNGFKMISDSFGSDIRNDIHWYYNPNQDFQYTPEIFQTYEGTEYLF
jgi:hypothetical protein